MSTKRKPKRPMSDDRKELMLAYRSHAQADERIVELTREVNARGASIDRLSESLAASTLKIANLNQARESVCTERDKLMERNVELAVKLETSESARAELRNTHGRIRDERDDLVRDNRDLARILHHALERGSR